MKSKQPRIYMMTMNVAITKPIIIQFLVHYEALLFLFEQYSIVLQAHLYPTLKPNLWYRFNYKR